VYQVSVRASTWYVLRVTARNAAGSADCYLKFQTARDDSAAAATLLPRRMSSLQSRSHQNTTQRNARRRALSFV